jgi:hypothetical protein
VFAKSQPSRIFVHGINRTETPPKQVLHPEITEVSIRLIDLQNLNNHLCGISHSYLAEGPLRTMIQGIVLRHSHLYI